MLRQGNCIKRITASGGGDLHADAGESFLIKRLYCVASTNETYLVLRIDRKTVGVYRAKGRYGNHLGYIRRDYIPMNLMAFLESKGVNVSLPVAEGQTFNVSRVAETGEVVIVYDIYDAGDITANMVNGSESKEFNFVQYMDAASYPSASGDILLDTSLSPAEFPDFPCGAVVPARHKIEVMGIAGVPVCSKVSTGNWIKSTFVKLIKDRETLFDEDRAGILFRAAEPTFTGAAEYRTDISLIGGGAEWWIDGDMDSYGEPLMFDPPLSFVAGEELLAYMTFVLTGSHTLESDTIDLAMLLKAVVE